MIEFLNKYKKLIEQLDEQKKGKKDIEQLLNESNITLNKLEFVMHNTIEADINIYNHKCDRFVEEKFNNFMKKIKVLLVFISCIIVVVSFVCSGMLIAISSVPICFMTSAIIYSSILLINKITDFFKNKCKRNDEYAYWLKIIYERKQELKLFKNRIKQCEEDIVKNSNKLNDINMKISDIQKQIEELNISYATFVIGKEEINIVSTNDNDNNRPITRVKRIEDEG